MIEREPRVVTVLGAAAVPRLRSSFRTDVQELLARGELDRAIAQLRTEGSEADRWTLAWLEQKRGEFDASLRTLDRVVTTGAPDPGVLLLRARVLWMKGDLGAAREELRGLAATAPAATAETAAGELATLNALIQELEPVAAGARRLEVGFWIAATLLAAIVATRIVADLRRAVRD